MSKFEKGKLPDGLVDFVVHHGVRGDLGNFPPSLARQEFAEECDINTLMARYESTGVMTHVNQTTPIYMDMTNMPDLRQSLDIMREASLAFFSLPAKVRREFDNSPQLFVDFAQDPKNLEKMREWGLAPAAKVPDPPIEVRVINPDAPVSDASPGPSSKSPVT